MCGGSPCGINCRRNAPKLQPSLADLTSSLLSHLPPLQQVSGSYIYLLLVSNLGWARSAHVCTTRWLTSVFIPFPTILADFFKILATLYYSYIEFLPNGFRQSLKNNVYYLLAKFHALKRAKIPTTAQAAALQS